jgi:eukaryotic-like serine/threonine-protein kinase
MIPGVTLERAIGRGGYAEVWAGRMGDAPVAVKLAHRGTDAARQRAAREAAALERLAGAHAPRLLASGSVEGRPYLVMELVAERRATAIGAIARAVAALHAAGVVHGDLKPENLALTGDSVTLLDFGSATLDGAPAPVGGSIEYMAPELWRGAPVTPASDVYALGVLLVELATGRPPFTGEARSVGYAHAMLRPDLGALPRELSQLAARCLAKDPAQRPRASEVAAVRPVAIISAPRLAETKQLVAPQLCALMIADVRAPAPALAAAVARAGGDVLFIRGARLVAAWTTVANGPAAAPRALACARDLHHEHQARAFLAIDHIPFDADAQQLRPGRAHVEPPWLPAQWHDVVGTARFAALVDAGAPDHALVDLTADAPPRPLAPLLGLGRDVSSARGRRVAIVGAPGTGTTHFARHLARARGVPYASARGLRELTGPIVLDDIADASDELLAAIERSPHAVAVVGVPRQSGADWERVELGPLDAAAAAELAVRELAVERVPEALVQQLVAAAAGLPRRICELVAHLRTSGAIRKRDDVDRWYIAADAISLPTHDLDAWLAESTLANLTPELRALVVACAGLEPGFTVGEVDAVIDTVGPAADPALGLVELATRGLARVDDAGAWQLASTALARIAVPPDPIALARTALVHAERAWHGDLDGRQRRALARYAAATGDRLRAAQLLIALADDARRAHHDVAAEADYTAALDLADDTATISSVADRVSKSAAAAMTDRVSHLPAGSMTDRVSHLPAGAAAMTDRVSHLPAGAAAMTDRVSHLPADAAAMTDRVSHLPAGAAAMTDRVSHLPAGAAAMTDRVSHLPAGAAAMTDRVSHSEATRLPGSTSADTAVHALLGRGVVRYRTDRARDAVDDLERASNGATDPVLAARARLELATAYDWLGDYAASARAVDEVGELTELACALAMARGRSAMRAGRYRDARACFEAALDSEGVVHADEQLVARMLLGPTLVQLGELDEAEAVFAAALATAEELGDTIARSALHGNRVLLWSARRDDARARADLEAARTLARRVGHAVPERNTTYNLAEYCYWHGELGEAARLATEARDLQRRLVGDAFEDEVLIARIAARAGDREGARVALARADATTRAWPPAIRCLRDAVAAYLDGAPDRFAVIEAAAHRDLVGAELDEVVAWATATRAG